MTIIVGSDIPTSSQIVWHAGGDHVPTGTEESTEVAGEIDLATIAEYGSVVVLDANGVETATCVELDSLGAPATQATGTTSVETSAAGTDKVYPDYVSIDTALIEVFATKDVKFSAAIDEFSEAIQGQADKVKATGAAGWDMTVSMMHYNLDFVALVFGTKTASSPAAGWSKHHTVTEGVKEIGTLVGKRYESGVLTAKYFAMGCSIKSLSEDFPASGFVADSFDFTAASKREIFKA
ncbi:MAG: hypothetical protein ACNYVW_03495 [Methanosarcinales archaeon]